MQLSNYSFLIVKTKKSVRFSSVSVKTYKSHISDQNCILFFVNSKFCERYFCDYLKVIQIANEPYMKNFLNKIMNSKLASLAQNFTREISNVLTEFNVIRI